MFFGEQLAELRPSRIIRNRDMKFIQQFCSILESDGIEFQPTPRRSPNLNPYAEVGVRRTKAECLDHFVVFGESHLRHILETWLAYYHRWRPHQGLGNVPIEMDSPSPTPLHELRLEDVVCYESLGGLLKHCERRAA